jgi:hypothetical protein
MYNINRYTEKQSSFLSMNIMKDFPKMCTGTVRLNSALIGKGNEVSLVTAPDGLGTLLLLMYYYYF